MSFEELWLRVKERRVLPDTAIVQVPGTLSEATKKKLARKTSEEVEKIVLAAIEEVNHGSVEPLDILIKKRLWPAL